MSLAFRKLRVAYGPVVAIEGLDLEVDEGQVVAIIGPNGAGKTSMLAAAIGLIPHAGAVVLDGKDLSRLRSFDRSRAGLGYVPSGKGVFGTLTVRDNVRVAAGKDFDAAWKRLTGWFPILETKALSLGSELSGGQQQIVSIARAMATSPRYLLLDEPSIGLSPIAVEHLAEVVRVLQRQKVSILLSEQNAGLAMTLSDRCVLLVRGEVRMSGTPDELRDKPEVEALYLGRSVEEA
jgi:branched-chain amino acid transport system ATP-binding protein